MKKIILTVLAFLGIVSRSNFAGAASALESETGRDSNSTAFHPTGICD